MGKKGVSFSVGRANTCCPGIFSALFCVECRL